jgi:HD-like signal output (HDOD) protein
VNPDLEHKLKKCTSLPTLSSVAFEVLQHSQAEDINLTEVARVIGRDPALVIRIIKMANSPMFGLRNQVRSVSQALAILGLNCVRTLVLSFSLVRDSAQERQGALAAF